MMRTVAILSMGLFLFLPIEGRPEQKTVRIAVASNGKTTDSSVSDKAARCKYFLIFAENGQRTEVFENPYGNAAGGAGLKAANFLAQKEVTLLVAGDIGAKMSAALKRKEIAHVKFAGTVEEGLQRALKDL